VTAAAPAFEDMDIGEMDVNSGKLADKTVAG
jgi:hypothetical protein